MGEQRQLFGAPTPPESSARGAILSPCGLYRYRLWRRWNAAPTAVFVMLNPSTADAFADDPTIRRCVGFAQSWGGFGAIEVVNLFAWRATDPAALFAPADRGAGVVGPDNDKHLRAVFAAARSVVCAWGAHRLAALRGREVLAMVPRGIEVSCLGTTKDGHPKHPLYLRADTAREPFEVSRG